MEAARFDRSPHDAPRAVALVGLIAGGHSGVPRYAAKLVQAIDRVAPQFPDLALRFVTNPAGAAASPVSTISCTVVRARGRLLEAGPGRLLSEHLAARRARGDLLHFFDISGPLLAPRRPFVATVHDYSALQSFRRSRDIYKPRLYPWALEHATAAVAVSQAAKDDICGALGVDPEKITVIHSGPGFGPAPGAVDADAAEAHAGEPFLLYVGNLARNKNLPLLVRAFHAAAPEARLVLVGRPGDGYADVEEAIAAGPCRDRIEVRLRVGDSEIDRLYRTASALLLPSIYEGFGFTPLEAMARGCPVVESDIPALREVSGDGALLVPFDDEAGWADAMVRVLADPALRADLRARGSECVARYSWDDTAVRLLELFRTMEVRPARAR